MSEPRAVLLDLDGTLVDSNDAHARCWVETLRELGYAVPFERVRPLIGEGSDKLLPDVLGIDAESEPGKHIVERRSRAFLERYVPSLRAFPRSAELVELLRRDGFRVVVATSANQKEMEALVRIAGIERFVDASTSSSEAENSKPDPDILEAALEKAGTRPEQALMLGDTPYDLAAARKAGVPMVAVRCGGWRDADLAGAVAIFDDPEQLLDRYQQSPFAAGR